MSDALISVLLRRMASLTEEWLRGEMAQIMGVEKDVLKLTGSLESIQATIFEAEKRRVAEEDVKLWLSRMKHVLYDIEDALTDWTTAESSSSTQNKKESSSCCFLVAGHSRWNLKVRRTTASRIRVINGRLQEIAAERVKYNLLDAGRQQVGRSRSTSFIDESKVRGRADDKNKLVMELASPTNYILSIVGMVGIGKTALAQLVYNCEEVKTEFTLRIWVCVSDPFDELRVAKAILEEVLGRTPDVAELQTALQRLHESTAGNKFLLVLDDVWTEDFTKVESLLKSLKSGAVGSKILVTTRSHRVSKMLGTSYTHRLELLSDQDCWDLFSHIAFVGRSEQDCQRLEALGRQISDKCQGLPLDAEKTGHLMRFKDTPREWQTVLDSDIQERGLLPSVHFSYLQLPSKVQPCFLYCASLPKGAIIEADDLIKIWMAHGYLTPAGHEDMEITGREYLNILVMHSLFQDVEKDDYGDTIIRFKIHNVVHEFVQFYTKDEYSIVEAGTTNPIHENIRHVTVIRRPNAMFPVLPTKSGRLRSLTFLVVPPLGPLVTTVSPNLFRHLKRVKVLAWSGNGLNEIPKEVGQLTSLRYLDLSHNPLTELPDTVCDLCNLQTLKLNGCSQLKRLPQGREKLINLRFLEIHGCNSLGILPKGIMRLVVGSGGNRL